MLVPARPADVVTAEPSAEADLLVDATLRAIDPAAGKVSVRLVLRAAVGSGLVEDGVLTEDVTLSAFDATGQGTRTLPSGGPLGAVTVTVPLAGSRATRYPFDRYEAFVVSAPATTTATSSASG